MIIKSRIKDYTGLRFGMLTVLGYEGNEESRKQQLTLWRCVCDCGNMVTVRNSYFGHKTHCGCVDSIRLGAGLHEGQQEEAIQKYKDDLMKNRKDIMTTSQQEMIDKAEAYRAKITGTAYMTIEKEVPKAECLYDESFLMPCREKDGYYY